MTIDTKLKIREGMMLHCGGLYTVKADVLFHNLYARKHGTCLEYVHARQSNPDSLREYMDRELEVYRRFMLIKVHAYDKVFK
jgi:hypothetical protein